MADLLAALIGIAMVAGIGWLAVASFVADARMERDAREAERDATEFIDEIERVHGRAFRAQEQ